MGVSQEDINKLKKLGAHIEKLRSLAKRSPFPEEADTSKRLALKLIEKYKKLPGGLQYIFYNAQEDFEPDPHYSAHSSYSSNSGYSDYEETYSDNESADFDDDEEDLFKILEKYQKLRKYHVREFDSIPITDGIFVVFEDGELFKGLDRVVYVGKHLRKGRLVTVIKRNFYEGNKNSAELRKFVGAALLNKMNDPYLDSWMDKEADPWNEKEMDVERLVTRYLTEHMYVAVLPEVDKEKRKEKWISMIRMLKNSYSLTNAASDSWLGKNSPAFIIREYGMWQKGFNP